MERTVEEKLKDILLGIVPETNTAAITPDSKLMDDLGLNSMSMMLIALEIEEAFGFEFDELVQISTVGEMMNYIASREMQRREIA